MFRLLIHEHAEEDLESIAEKDPDGAYFIAAFLEELEGDQHLLDRLSEHGYHAQGSDDWAANFNVSVWASQQEQKRNLWRLRSWELEAERYRIVYAFDAQQRTYVVLGVFQRSKFNYEQSSPLTARVIEDYESL